MHLTPLQKILSHLYPIRVRRGSSPYNPFLELCYYQGRWQLGTMDVLYSDGHRYRPLVTAFNAIREQLPALKQVLVLGTGLGSAVTILERLGYHPRYTLVELDQLVLDWALECQEPYRERIRPVCADAGRFMKENQECFDLVIVDVFIGRQVPDFVLQPAFLRQCRAALRPGGVLVMNYMVQEPGLEGRALGPLEQVFRQVKELSLGVNRVYIARA